MLNCSVSDLVGDVWSSITDIATHLAHDSDVLVTVQERVLLLALCAGSAISTCEDCLVGFETGIGEDDNQSFGVFIGGWDWDMLLCHELREGWRRKRLCS